MEVVVPVRVVGHVPDKAGLLAQWKQPTLHSRDLHTRTGQINDRYISIVQLRPTTKCTGIRCSFAESVFCLVEPESKFEDGSGSTQKRSKN